MGAVSSLAIFTSLFDPFAAAKTFVIAVGAMGLFGYGLLEILRSRKVAARGGKGVFLVLLTLFVVLFLVRAVTTSDVNGAMFGVVGRHSGFITYFAYSLIFVLTMLFTNPSNFRLILHSLLIAGFVAGGYSLLEKLEMSPWKFTQVYGGTSGLFGNPNFSGAFLSLSAILSAWYLIEKNKLNLRIFSLVTLLLSVYGVYTSKALQGVISIFIGITVLVLNRFFVVNKKLGISASLVALIVGAVGLLGSFQMGPLSLLLHKGSVSERGDMWRTAIAMIKDQPLWGVGIERYGFYFRQYRDLKQSLRAGPDVFSDNAHNVILHLTATGGVFLGLLFFLISTGVAVVGFRGVFASQGEKRNLLAIALALWLPIQAQNIISVDNPGVFLWSWILGGAIVALAFEKEPSQEEKISKRNKSQIVSSATVHPLAPVISLVCVLLTLGVVTKPLIAQKSFNFAFYLGIDTTLPETLKNKEAALIKAEQQDPGNLTWPRYSANSLFVDKAWKESIAAGNRAVSKDPEDWISWWFIASAYEQSGDRVSAIPARTKTVELDPLNTSVLLELAKDQIAAGDQTGFDISKKAILRINPSGADAAEVNSITPLG